MSKITRTIDRYYAIRIMSILSKEFPEWPAFKTGIIDATGNVIKRAKTKEEKDSYTRLDAVLRSVKQILNKFPGGVSALARAYLVKGFLYENQEEMFREVYWLSESIHATECEQDLNSIISIIEALIGLNSEDEFFISIFEEVVAGDSGGDPQKIATGETSGAVTFPGPGIKSKKKVDKKKDD